MGAPKEVNLVDCHYCGCQMSSIMYSEMAPISTPKFDVESELRVDWCEACGSLRVQIGEEIRTCTSSFTIGCFNHFVGGVRNPASHDFIKKFNQATSGEQPLPANANWSDSGNPVEDLKNCRKEISRADGIRKPEDYECDYRDGAICGNPHLVGGENPGQVSIEFCAQCRHRHLSKRKG